MNKTLLVACAVAGGLFAALAAPRPAQALPSVNLGIEKNADTVTHIARRGGGGGFRGGGRGFRGGGRSFGGGRGIRGGRGFRGRAYGSRRGFRGRGYRRGRVYGYRGYNKRRYRRRRFRRGRVYGYYGGYYTGTCGWLRRRAYATGSPYWWDRYYRCRNYYY